MVQCAGEGRVSIQGFLGDGKNRFRAGDAPADWPGRAGCQLSRRPTPIAARTWSASDDVTG